MYNATCPSSGTGTTNAHTYDAADRITDTGTSYDALGRTTAMPAVDSPSGYATTMSYYTNDLVHSMTANGSTTTYGVDPAMRADSWSDGTITHTNHYLGDNDDPAWTAENNTGTAWTRNITAFDGLAATVTHSGTTDTVTLDLSNLHGDIFSTVTPATSDWLLDLGSGSQLIATDEYGNQVGGSAQRYDYLGSKQRQRDTNSDLQLMGQRVYNSTTGRFVQTDPVVGGSANNYDYAAGDPVNRSDLSGRWVFGACLGVSIVLGWGASVGGCFVADTHGNTGITTFIGTGGGYEVGGSVGALISSAPDIFALAGWSSCGSASLGPIAKLWVSICLWRDKYGNLDVTTLFGVAAGIPVGASLQAVHTSVYHIKGFWSGVINSIARWIVHPACNLVKWFGNPYPGFEGARSRLGC